MYKKILMLLLAFMFSGIIFMSCSSEDGGGTTPTLDPLTVVTPNGGGLLQMGHTVAIYFESNITEDISVSLYKADEFVYEINAAEANKDSSLWTIPTTLVVGTDYKIKIQSVTDSTKYDFSDANFTIAPKDKYIIVTSSNGGDIWTKGSLKHVTWYDNILGNVNISLLKNGAHVIDIFDFEQVSDGDQGWTIPGTLVDGADYTIKIVSVDSTALNDVSDNFFCIADENSTQNIVGDWTVTFSKQPEVFNFEVDGTITADSSGTNIGAGTWEMIGNGVKVYDSETSTYLLGIVDGNDITGHMLIEDGTMIDWSAERVIPDLLTPNGGEVWMHGTTQTITWDTAIAGNVVLSLADSTGLVQEIAIVLGSDGTYNWTVPNTVVPGAAYLIRVAKEINGEALDQSDNYLAISADVTVDIIGEWKSSFMVTKADMTMQFNIDGTGTFTSGGVWTGNWTLTGNGLSFIIDGYTNDWIAIVDVDKFSGTFNDGGNLGVWDGQRQIDITYPNGGEVLEMGSIVPITWTTNITADFVQIDLYENDIFLRTLFANNVNNYSKNWTVPNDLTTSTKYKIRITSTTSDIYDESDDYFRINGITPINLEDENFKDGIADNWTGLEGVWTVVDSVYTVDSDSLSASTAYFNTPLTGNYVFEVKIRKTAGNLNFFGIQFNGDHSVIDSDGYWSNTAMLILDDTDYGFYTCVNGSFTALPNWTYNSNVVPGLNSWNVLKVIVCNDTGDYHIFINDQYINSVNNTSFSEGELGIINYDNTLSGTLEVDYIKVGNINKSEIDDIEKNYVKLIPSSAPHIK